MRDAAARQPASSSVKPIRRLAKGDPGTAGLDDGHDPAGRRLHDPEPPG
jgi:hypothetical protein